MIIILLRKNARSAVIEISDGGIYYTNSNYKIYINDKLYKKTSTAINCIFG